MSSSNSWFLNVETLGENYTEEDLINIQNTFQNKVKEMNVEDWVLEIIFPDIFDLNDGKITINCEGDDMRYDERQKFSQVLKIIIDLFRELDFELSIPEIQPYWICDWGPGDCYETRYNIFKEYKFSMDDLKDGESDDKEAIYIDYDGEDYDMNDEWYGDDDEL